MKLFFDSEKRFVETDKGIDLSISFGKNGDEVSAWYLDSPVISAVETADFIGSVEKGAPINFNNIFFNPHAHVTHTESLGHITKEFHSVNSIEHPLFYTAELISVEPQQMENGDQVITLNQLSELAWPDSPFEALVIRTLPNSEAKRRKQYSNSNPAFISVECAAFIKRLGVKHLLIDLPSVDKEQDNGELAFHHAFWGVPDNPDYQKTITEFIFVPEYCTDGSYLLNLQVAPIDNDASPSRPKLHKIFKA